MANQDVEVQAFVLCDSVSQDARRKMFVSGIFDQIHARTVPAIHPQITAYYRVAFRRGPGYARVQLAHVAPSGIRQVTPAISSAIAENGMLQGSFSLNGFQLPEFGVYAFWLVLNDKDVARYPFTVHRLKEKHHVVH